jgi:hypothetical protein
MHFSPAAIHISSWLHSIEHELPRLSGDWLGGKISELLAVEFGSTAALSLCMKAEHSSAKRLQVQVVRRQGFRSGACGVGLDKRLWTV